MKFSNKTNESIKDYLSFAPHNVIGIAIYNKDKGYCFNSSYNKLLNNDLIFDLGSISKTFTAHLVLKYVEQNKLDLDQQINCYLNLAKGHYPTVRQLLSHQSGYGYLTPFTFTIPGFLFHRYSRHNLYQDITNDDVIKKIKPIKNKKYNFKYSDFNYAILAVIIAKIENKDFGEIMQEFISKDLGLKSTFMSYNLKRNLNSFKGKKSVGFWSWKANNPYLSGGGISTTILDMKNYLKLELTSQEKYIKNAHERQDENNSFITCLGWRGKTKSHNLFHVGCVSCFHSYILINPVRNIGVAILANSKGKKQANARYIGNAIFNDLKRNKVNFKEN